MQRQGRGFAGRGRGRKRRIPDEILARMRTPPRRPARASHPRPKCSRTSTRFSSARSSTAPRWSGPRRRRWPAAWPPTRCCWRRAGSRSSTTRQPWRTGSACPSSRWNAALDLADAAHGPAAEIGLPARLAGRPCRVLAATEAPPAMPCSRTWRRCAGRASTWPWRRSSSSTRRSRRSGPRADRPGGARPAARAAGQLGRRSRPRPGR